MHTPVHAGKVFACIGLLIFVWAVSGIDAQERHDAPLIDLFAPRPIFDIYNPLLGEHRTGVALGLQSGFHRITLLGGPNLFSASYISDELLFGFYAGVGYQFRRFSVAALYHNNDYNDSLDFVRGVENGASLEIGLDLISLPIYIRNRFFIGSFHTRNSGNMLAIHNTVVAYTFLYTDYDNAVALRVKSSLFHALQPNARSYGVGISLPMSFFDRRLIIEPFAGVSGHPNGAPESFADDFAHREFEDFSPSWPLSGQRSSPASGNIAFVLKAEYRIFILEGLIDPALENIFIGPFANSGLFIDNWRPAVDLTGGIRAGVTWGSSFVLSTGLGYNLREHWIFGLNFSSDI